MRMASPVVTVVAICVLALAGTAGAARDDAAAPRQIPTDLLEDLRALPSTGNFWWLAAGAGAALSVHQFEDAEGIARYLNEGWRDAPSDAGNIWGDARVQAPLSLAVWGLGALRDDLELADTGYDMVRGLLLTAGVVSTIKVAVDRERPEGDRYSFPSGHTALAFTTAGVISRHYGAPAAGVAIGLGVLTGFGRMEDRRHYASDVVAGATLGWIIGRTVARGDDRRRNLSVVPRERGVALVFRF